MFGMNKSKGPQSSREQFDLEKELSDPARLRATKEQLETRIQQLKTVMRQGGDQQSFDQAQTVLNGYLAAQKVVGRINRKTT